MTQKIDYLSIVLGAILLGALYLISRHSYLLFHSLAEVFSIVIAFSIFIIAWNSRRLMENSYLLFLGIAYLFIGGIDLIHTLAYPGMGVFPDHNTNLPTQLWLAARYTESLSLLLAPLFLGRRLKVQIVLLGYMAATAIFLGTIFYWDVFPACFVEGRGLTAFKKTSEYVISFVLLGAIGALARRRQHFGSKIWQLLTASIVLTIASELAFTLYTHAYGLSNLIGHYLKIVSFYLIYKALIETGLREPYALLFREIKQSEEALRASEYRYRSLFESTIVGIVSFSTDGTIVSANQAIASILGYRSRSELIGERAETLCVDKDDLTQAAAQVMRTGYLAPQEVKLRQKHGKTIYALLSATIDKDTGGQAVGFTATRWAPLREHCLFDRLSML